MKLFPEQTTGISHHLSSIQQQQQHQPSSMVMLSSGSQGTIISNNYPLAMDCDPPQSLPIVNNATTIIGPSSITGPTATRYGSHHHRGTTNRYPPQTQQSHSIGPHSIIGGHKIASSTAVLSTFHANNYAPTSLPVDLGPMDHHPVTNGYQSHQISVGNYAPSFAMTNDLSMTGMHAVTTLQLQQQQQQQHHNNIMMCSGGGNMIGNGNGNGSGGGSNSSSSGTSSKQTLSSTGGGSSTTSASSTTASTSHTNGSNDRDDSPMVGVCVQQSPVVIH